MADEHPIFSYDKEDDGLFSEPVRGANLPPARPPAHPPAHFFLPAAQAPAPPPNPFGFSAEDAEMVSLLLDDVTFKLHVVKAQVDDTAVALFYDSGRCDITLQPGRKLTVVSRDQELQVVYAGGKVAFGQYSLLSFIRGVTSAVS